jgi:cell fate (sporulation/competence/biofilm development) regulator YlbF (YheA/YmcA/DUF963 family)
MSMNQTYDLELGAEMRDAAQAFAVTLRDTPVFQAFEQTAATLRDDVVARCAIDAYQQRVASLRALLTLGAVSAEEQMELDRLRRAYEEEPSVVAYLAAQRELVSLMQSAGDRLSEQLGLDFAAACGGCGCG